MSRSTLIALLLAFSLPVIAGGDRPEHYDGKPARTIAEARANIHQGNAELRRILVDGNLEPADMARVHELTYTLENALNKIRAEADALAVTLEEVHLASERADTGTVRDNGAAYLDSAAQLVPGD